MDLKWWYEQIIFTKREEQIIEFWESNWKIILSITVMLSVITFTVGMSLLLTGRIKIPISTWISVGLSIFFAIVARFTEGIPRIITLLIAIFLLFQPVAGVVIYNWWINREAFPDDVQNQKTQLRNKANKAFDAMLFIVNDNTVEKLSPSQADDLNIALQDGKVKYETDEDIDIDVFAEWYVNEYPGEPNDDIEKFRRQRAIAAFLRVYFVNDSEIPKTYINELFLILGFDLVDKRSDALLPFCGDVEGDEVCTTTRVFWSKIAGPITMNEDETMVIRSKFEDWYVKWGTRSKEDAKLTYSQKEDES